MMNTWSAYSAIESANGERTHAKAKLAGNAIRVPITEPDAIFRMLEPARPWALSFTACSTMGADITPPGIPATATGIESVSFFATIALIKKAKTTGIGTPTRTRARVTGARTADAYVPGGSRMNVKRIS